MSIIKQQINDLLQKEMDRKDFLKHMGVAAVALIGVPAVIKALSQSSTQSSAQSTKNMGYGLSAYGGSLSSSKVNKAA